MLLKRPPVQPRSARARSDEQCPGDPESLKARALLIERLLDNAGITEADMAQLRQCITAVELSNIIQRIYDLNEKNILELSLVDGLMRTFNQIKNSFRNRRFDRKIRKGFRNLNDHSKKVILAEGDSWFNYPVILTDIVDRIAMEKNFAVYSLASGGDWLLNMLTARQYVQEMSVVYPDVFLISGGGNDLVGSRRLAAIISPQPGSELSRNFWAQEILNQRKPGHVPFSQSDFDEGCKYLSKDFFALLMFFHLQYYYLISGIIGSPGKHPESKRPSKFPNIRIITQGYDYPIPSFALGFGWNPMKWYKPFVRVLLGHGGWLKRPMMQRGILDAEIQRKVIYAMIHLFNEMMINIGDIFEGHCPKTVFHIDARGAVGEDGWADELHAKPEHFMRIGDTFINCIRNAPPTYRNVYVVGR